MNEIYYQKPPTVRRKISTESNKGIFIKQNTLPENGTEMPEHCNLTRRQSEGNTYIHSLRHDRGTLGWLIEFGLLGRNSEHEG